MQYALKLFVVAISCIAIRWLNGVEAPLIGSNFLFPTFCIVINQFTQLIQKVNCQLIKITIYTELLNSTQVNSPQI